MTKKSARRGTMSSTHGGSMGLASGPRILRSDQKPPSKEPVARAAHMSRKIRRMAEKEGFTPLPGHTPIRKEQP